MIIKFTSTQNIEAEYLSNYPDIFVTEKKMTTDKDHVKQTMDFFASRAYADYSNNTDKVLPNYDLLKGVMRAQDYIPGDDNETDLFIQTLEKDLKLPSHIKHYPILNPPLNEMVGGLSKKKNTHRAKALDSDSQSEEFEAKTETMWNLIITKAKLEILEGLQESGQLEQIQQENDPQKLQQLQKQIQEELAQKVDDDLINYTSAGEKWANHIMRAMRTECNLKELGEELLRDFLTCSRFYALVEEDNSKRGFGVEYINPRNVSVLTTPDKKYTKDAFAVSIVQVMEISEIIDKLDVTKEEIDHLRKSFKNYAALYNIPTNYGTNNTGMEHVNYTTYSPLIQQEREIFAAECGTDDTDFYNDIFGLNAQPNPSTFGYKYVVVRTYFIGKKLIKKVTYTDEDGIEQTVLADENYVNGTIPTEISVEEGWINQIYRGLKVGNEVYNIKPVNHLSYIPVIGGIFDTKNSPAASLVDMMKPFQILYNIVVNQLHSFLGKDKGKVFKINFRRVPIPKDGEPEDAVDIMLDDAKERGIILEDDSPENTKAPIQNTQVTQAIDLDQSAAIQTRIQLAKELKFECWELVGFTMQRLSSPTPGETATANQNALQVSYTQTEPYYIQHRYVMNQLYQAIVDTAQYIEQTKPTSTLSYLNDRGESAFIQVTPTDIHGRDIHIYVTSSEEDEQIFRQIQSLSQAVLQNDGTLDDVAQMYTTNSIRELRRVTKSLADKREKMEQFRMEMEQKQLALQNKAAEEQIRQQAVEKDKERQFEAWQNDLDRLNEKEVALIRAMGFQPELSQDADNSGVADALERTKQEHEVDKVNKEYSHKSKELSLKEKERQDKLLVELQKLQVEREKIKAQLQISKDALKNPVAGEKKKKPTKTKK